MDNESLDEEVKDGFNDDEVECVVEGITDEDVEIEVLEENDEVERDIECTTNVDDINEVVEDGDGVLIVFDEDVVDSVVE